MKIIKWLFIAVCLTQLAGCMGTLKVLSAIGKGTEQQRQQQPAPNYYPSYQAPTVQQPTLNKTQIKHCRTIGYVTTCQ